MDRSKMRDPLLFAKFALESSFFCLGLANYGNLVGLSVGKSTKQVPTVTTVSQLMVMPPRATAFQNRQLKALIPATFTDRH